MSEWLTVPEAAKYLKVSRPTIFRWMRTGQLSFYKFGRATRFRRDELDRIAQRSTSKKEAEDAKRRCAVCGNSEFVPGRLRSTGRVYFQPEKTRFLVVGDSFVGTEALACTACGHVQMFADTEKLASLVPEE